MRIVVLDASVVMELDSDGVPTFVSGVEKYVEGHIPGAQFADLFVSLSDTESRFPFMRPSTSQFEGAMRQLGISNDSTVVIYDSLINQWAARVWWLLRTYGHTNAYLLDGGLSKWRSEGRPTSTGYGPFRGDGLFVAREDSRIVSDKREVEDVVAGKRPGLLVCSLAPTDYAGEVSPRPRRGHIPGSTNIPVSGFVSPIDTTIGHGATSIEGIAAMHGDHADTRIILYCGGGIGSLLLFFVLNGLGVQNLSLYDGWLIEWIDDADAPLEIGGQCRLAERPIGRIRVDRQR